MQIYEIINPSDPYTMRCDDVAVVAASLLFLGRGQYAAEPYFPLAKASAISTVDVPMFAVGIDVKQWFSDRYDIDDLDAWIRENRLRIADALDTVLIGMPEERDALDETLAEMTEEQRAAFLDRRHDKMRSSLNDIGMNASIIAEKLREGFKDKEEDEEPEE